MKNKIAHFVHATLIMGLIVMLWQTRSEFGEKITEISSPKPAFERVGSFLGDDLSLVRMHHNDYSIMNDHLGLFQTVDVENFIFRLHGNSRYYGNGGPLTELSPIRIPVQPSIPGELSDRWAIWTTDQYGNSKWSLEDESMFATPTVYTVALRAP